MIQIAILITLSLAALKRKNQILFALLAPVFVLGDSRITLAKTLYLLVLIILNLIYAPSTLEISIVYIIKKMNIINKLLIFLLIQIIIVGIYNSFSIVEVVRSSVILLIFLLNFRLILNSFRFWNYNQAYMFLILVGLIGAISTFYTWIQRRGVLELQTDRLALDADYFAILAICISIYTNRIGIAGFKRNFEIIITSVMVVFLLATLSRTYIVLLSFLFIFALFKNTEKRIRQYLRNLSVVSLTIALLLIFTRLLNEMQYQILQTRIFDSVALISKSHNTSSNSYLESLTIRKAQGLMARDMWLQSPIFGKGALPSGFTFDSIFGAFAKYGIIGIVLICLILLILYQTLNSGISKSSLEHGIATFIFIVLVPSSLIGNWTENKSVWLSINLILFLLLVRNYETNEKREIG